MPRAEIPAGGAHRRVGAPEPRRPTRGSCARYSWAAVRRGLLHYRQLRRRHRRPLAVARTAYALLGPTASGKSKLALELAARRPIEIVSVDSAQVYRGMDIGTAKASITERASVAHHLVDVVDPDHSYSTGRWRNDAIRAVGDILNKEKIPLLVGGTMLYYRALVAGL